MKNLRVRKRKGLSWWHVSFILIKREVLLKCLSLGDTWHISQTPSIFVEQRSTTDESSLQNRQVSALLSPRASPAFFPCSLLKKAEWRMAVLGLGSSYFVNPAGGKHICLIHLHVILFLAHTPPLPESFRFQFRHGRTKGTLTQWASLWLFSWWQHSGFPLGSSHSSLSSHVLGGCRASQSGPTSLHPND